MIKSRADLERIKASEQVKLAMRNGYKRMTVIVEMGDEGITFGAKEVLNYFVKKLNENIILDVAVIQGSGSKLKGFEPIVEIRENDITTTYQRVDLNVVDLIIENHIKNNLIVTEALYIEPEDK